MLALPETLPDSYDELRQTTLSLLAAYRSQSAELKEKTLQVEALKFELARLKRWKFGASSEQLDASQIW